MFVEQGKIVYSESSDRDNNKSHIAFFCALEQLTDNRKIDLSTATSDRIEYIYK